MNASCLHCGKSFKTYPCRVDAKFCGRVCRGLAERMTLDQFMAKVEKRESGCWEWTGAVSSNGYGIIGALCSTHRFAYESMVGEIPSGLCVCHHCDNRICVNPSHLFLGTKADNTDDMMAKGRHRARRGGEHGMAKLDEASVRQIKRLLRESVSQDDIARRFGIARTTVSTIATRRCWGWVEV